MPVAAETKQFPCAACGVSREPPIKPAVYQLFDFLRVVAIGKLAGKTICALVEPAINAQRDTVNRAPSVARVRNHNSVSDFRQSEPTSIGREGSFSEISTLFMKLSKVTSTPPPRTKFSMIIAEHRSCS